MQGEFDAAGDIATGGVLGRAVEPAAGEWHHGLAGQGAADAALCLNCGTALSGQFCHRCGQSAHVHRTIASIGHDLLHGVWHFEGKIWRTLPLLFTRPGALTRRYCAGERARFVSPLALFLFSVFLMFATFESIGGPFGGDDTESRVVASKEAVAEMSRELRARERELATLNAVIGANGAANAQIDRARKRAAQVNEDIAALRTAVSIRSGGSGDGEVKGQIKTGIPALDTRIAHALKEPKLFLYKLQSSAYKYSWALIPISLPFIWMLFPFRRDVGPYDHAIFAIYSLSAMTMGVVLLSIGRAIGLPSSIIAVVLVFGPPLHMYRQLRGAYRIGRAAALWRTAALLLFSALSALLFFIAVLGITSG